MRWPSSQSTCEDQIRDPTLHKVGKPASGLRARKGSNPFPGAILLCCFAEAWGLKAKGVLYVIMAALRCDLLDNVEAKETELTLVRKGLRIEPNLLARIIKEMDSYNRKCK